jgi:hypothetical protein
MQKTADLESFNATKSQTKKLAGVLYTKVAKLRALLETQTTLEDCWRTQKQLDREEAAYDAARLATIPQNLAIKLVGDGFKVGVGDIWLEELDASFDCSMIPREHASSASPSSKNPHSRACVTSQIGSDAQLGVVSFKAHEIYLKSDNFPTLRLESFEAKCEFTATVPIHFKTERQRWKVGPGMKINLKKIESKMATSGGLTANPPQSMIRFATEQILKMIITKNLKQFFPPEIGIYMESVKSDHVNAANGTLKVTGPHCNDLESLLVNSSSKRAHDLLKLTAEQAAVLVQFARAVAGIDIKSTVRLVQYYKDNVVMNQNEETAKDLVLMWQLAYEKFAVMKSSPPINMKELFKQVKSLSENPIAIKMDFSHLDMNIEVQPMLKVTSSLMTRLLYENFGGNGVVGSCEETDHPNDVLLRGVRRTINRIFVPFRRSVYSVGKNVKRVTAEVQGEVAGKPKEIAKLSLALSNLQVLCTPSLPTSFVDFMTRSYSTTCRTHVMEGGARKFAYKMVKDEEEEEEEEEEEDDDDEEGAGSLPKFVMAGHFINMNTIGVYNPEVTKGGSFTIQRMPVYHGRPDMLTEESLRTTCAETASEGTPLLAHFTSDEMRMSVPLMAMVPEMISNVADFLKWGGASFAAEGTASPSGMESDERMLHDLRDKFKRILVIIMKIVHKHTSTETFQMIVNSSLRLSSDADGVLSVEVQGSASGADEKLPLSLMWTTTFVDIVQDMKKVLDEFRRGGSRSTSENSRGSEVGAAALSGGSSSVDSLVEDARKKGRRMSKKFGEMFSTAFSSPLK